MIPVVFGVFTKQDFNIKCIMYTLKQLKTNPKPTILNVFFSNCTTYMPSKRLCFHRVWAIQSKSNWYSLTVIEEPNLTSISWKKMIKFVFISKTSISMLISAVSDRVNKTVLHVTYVYKHNVIHLITCTLLFSDRPLLYRTQR